MAQAGIVAAQVVRAHADLCDEWGDTVYMLDRVHKRIVAGDRQKPTAPDDDDDGIRPLAEIIAEQRAAGIYSGSIRTPLTRPASAP